MEKAIAQMGGFGRFQWLAAVTLIIAKNGGIYFYYAFAFLTLEQMYQCRYDTSSPFTSCQAETDICPVLASGLPTSLEYQVDTSYAYYLNNWYAEMDLVCVSKVKTNSMISIHYIFYGISGILFFSMTDRIGRKPTMTIMYGIHSIGQYLLLFVPTYSARLIGLMILGFSQLKNTVPYVYLAELVPAKYETAMSASITSFDCATAAVVCLYFITISRDWFPLFFAMTLLSTLSYLTIVFILPESPIWLLNKGRTADAIAALNKIGRYNGVEKQIPADAVFLETKELMTTT